MDGTKKSKTGERDDSINKRKGKPIRIISKVPNLDYLTERPVRQPEVKTKRPGQK